MSLNGVSCASVRFCAAVGGQHVPNFGSRCCHPTLVETWNGTEWSVVPRPSSSKTLFATLADVSCVSSRFCMAVGRTYGAIGGGPEQTLAASWNGTEWSIVPTPNRGALDELDGVSCVSARSCVAVGWGTEIVAGGSFSTHALVESWNGTEWSVVPSPSPSGFSVLKGVSCLNAKHCVAVGGSESGTLVEAWNGSTWSVLESPNPEGSGTPRLTGVSCVSAGSCAAVGSDSTERPGPSQTLVEKSNGGKWSIVPSANSASGVSYLGRVSCVSTQACFAVGEDEATPEGQFQTLVEAGGIQSWGGFGFFRF